MASATAVARTPRLARNSLGHGTTPCWNAICFGAERSEPSGGGVPMKLQVLAGALALGLGASALAPVTARADDGDHGRSYHSYRSNSYHSDRSYHSDGHYHSNHSYHSGSYHAGAYHSHYSHPYNSYAYPYPYYAAPYYPAYAYGGYYGSYAPYGYGAHVAVYPSYGYHGYRPLVSLSVGGPHFGVWLGF